MTRGFGIPVDNRKNQNPDNPIIMNYYHIIYNSSESSMTGGAGFGIRTATEGTPESLIEAIRDINLFNDMWEDLSNQPTTAQIKEHPEIMDDIAKYYAVTSITDRQGKMFHIIARRAYVGFNYAFYSNGIPTRPGNYVIDYYAFEELPESSVYQILYEKALPESNHFIPASVRPTEDNEEMRTISLGKQAPLPVETKSFEADVKDSLDKDVVKLFFTYLKAKQNGKKLVVRVTKERARTLAADFYRMLDRKSATEIHTLVNHRSNGINNYFDIYFILPDYPHQLYPGLYEYMDIDNAEMPDTDEAKTFGKELLSLVRSAFSNNKTQINDILRWLMMPEYATVKKMSKETIDNFFLYCIQRHRFNYTTLKYSSDELLRVLSEYTKKDTPNAEHFDNLVTEAMNTCTTENIIDLISDFHKFESYGFNMQDNTQAVMGSVSRCILSSAAFLCKVLDRHTVKGTRQFFDKSIFEEHCDYVEEKVLYPYMLDLYKVFLTEAELKGKDNMLYNRFVLPDMDKKYLIPIIDDTHGSDNEAKVQFFITILQKRAKPAGMMWEMLEHYLNQGTCPDLLNAFSDRLTEKEYAPLFYYSIKANRNPYQTISGVEQLTEILEGNDSLKKLISNGFNSDNLYTPFLGEIKRMYKDNHENAAEALRKLNSNVLGFLNIRNESFVNLAMYLDMVVYDRYDDMSTSTIPAMFYLVRELEDRDSFDRLLHAFLKAADKNSITQKELIALYENFNPGVDVKEEIDDLNAAVADPLKLDIILRERKKMTFKKAFEIISTLDMKKEWKEAFFEKSYAKEYKSYKRNQKIKGFFKAIFGVFKPKK